MPDQKRTSRCRTGFSLIELVIVVVIIGIIGAIAIPRLSRGAGGASVSALRQDLIVLNNALELYAAEHHGNYPPGTAVEQKLLGQTYSDGHMADGTPGRIVYGPYLRQVPPAPVGPRRGATKISTNDGDDVGWIYNTSQNNITINTGAQTLDDALGAEVGRTVREVIGR